MEDSIISETESLRNQVAVLKDCNAYLNSLVGQMIVKLKTVESENEMLRQKIHKIKHVVDHS